MVAPLKPYSTTDGPYKAPYPPNPSYMQTYYVRTQSGYRQTKPYNVDTSYSSVRCRLVSGLPGSIDAGSWSWGSWGSPGEFWESTKTSAVNQVRQRFVSELGSASSFGATLTAELRETWGTVVDLITRSALAARAVRKLHFFDAARILGVPYQEYTKTYEVKVSQKRRKVYRVRRMQFAHYDLPKTLASGWLLWSYGVSPLTSDIYNGMDVLQRPTPESRIAARASATRTYAAATAVYKYEVTTRLSAFVQVINPNLWLCNQLGLVNPAQWANEAIPFSFVADWFSNLSQVIQQMTDFTGLQINRPCFTHLAIATETELYAYGGPATKAREDFGRELFVPDAKLQFAWERFSWQRGLNAISLLIGFLPKR